MIKVVTDNEFKKYVLKLVKEWLKKSERKDIQINYSSLEGCGLYSSRAQLILKIEGEL